MVTVDILLAATLISTGLLAVVLWYLHASAGTAYLRYWAVHWTVSSLGLGLALLSGVAAVGTVTAPRQLLALASAVFLFLGSVALRGTRAPRGWWIPVAAAAIWIVTAGFRELPFMLETLPVYWLRGGLTVWAGVLLLRLPREFGAERLVPGLAFVIDGLHLADFPFLGQVEWFLPWALLISLSNRFVIGIGMLLLHFRQAQSASERSEQRFQSAFELSPMATTIGDLETGVVFEANRGMTEILGYAPEELVGVAPEDMEIWTDLNDRSTMMDALEEGRAVHDFRAVMRHKGGDVRRIALTAGIIPMPDRPHLLMMGRDVTEQVRSEDRVRRLVRILEATPDLVAIWDRSGRALYLNSAARAFLEVGEDDDLGGVLASALLDPPLFRTALRTALRAGSWTGESVLRDSGGTPTPASVAIIAHRDPDGRVGHLSSLVRDISDVRSLQAQLLQSQKLEALGQLAGGVAHDFNNLLTVIGGYADVLEETGATDEQRSAAREVRLAQERASKLTHQLLAFARKQTSDPQPLSLDAQLRHVESLLRRLIGEDVQMIVTPDSGRTVCMDPAHLDQAVINLVINARDAIGEAGHIRVASRAHRVPDRHHRERGGLDPGDYAIVSVSDDGSGIDEATQARVFEPFFTTKPAGSGTGLGLSTVYGIVEQSGGTIRMESVPGRGTTFEIVLPAVQAETAPEATTREPPPPNAVSGTILVVEDEPAVRALVIRHLATMGYRVLEAGDGLEAIRRIHEAREHIDALVTDVVMPEVGGGEVTEHFRHAYPTSAVVLMSGFTDQRIQPQLLEEDGVAFLAKPFSRADLGAALRESFASAEGG